MIPAEALRADDFASYYPVRKQKLLALIERVMGKSATAVSVAEEGNEDEA
jgi:hypothetical protein